MKIGVFDSGVGGKLIAEKIRHAIPQATVIFKSDAEFFPYGDKPQSFILDRSIALTQKLKAKGCHLIVVACNAATTNTINALRQKFPQLTFVGIEPPIKPIVNLSQSKKVAIMGTEAAMKSHRYHSLKEKFGQGTTVFDIPCPGLAEAIEATVHSRNVLSNPFREWKSLDIQVQTLLGPAISAGVDVVGLGCTHYPYLLPLLKKLYPHVTFYDPADAVVAQVKKLALSPPER